MRSYAAEAFREQLPGRSCPRLGTAFGSSGTINAIVAAGTDSRRLTRRRLEKMVRTLADSTLAERRRRFEPKRAEIIVAGAVILEAAMRHLGLEAVVAVTPACATACCADLVRRTPAAAAAAAEGRTQAVLALGRRFGFDERHARQVSRLALQLFDQLATLHGLPASARGLLEAAALLHDVGHAVSPSRHHKHSFYLVQNADIAGFTERERLLVALVARYHRRTPPEHGRPDLEVLSAGELRQVRRLVALLRIADALDRGHHQPVGELRTSQAGRRVRVAARTRAPIDLELWDVAREAAFFRAAMGRRLEVVAARR